MQHADKVSGRHFQKEKTYKIGSQLFNIKREYCGDRKLGDILSDMIIKKEVSGK